MKDIVADKFLSYLVTNNIYYGEDNGFIYFDVKNNGKIIRIYYYKKRFFIDSKKYNGQPHIIKHWNLKNDKTKFGLCLTMDGKDRRKNLLNVFEQIKRIEKIVFELWDDPIGERFRELNVSLQTKLHNSFYLSYDKKIKWLERRLLMVYDHDISHKVKFITIKFKGQQKNDILNNKKIINSNKKYKLIKIKYKKYVKKLFLDESNNIFKISDFSPNSFWERTNKNNMIKKQRNIKIVGLGSIGGLVLDYVCKFGYENLEIYDDDVMEVENNPRHVLGIPVFKFGFPKVLHLFDHYSRLFPMLKIKPIFNKFYYSKNKILDNDLIFDTTGGSISKMKEDFFTLCDKNKDKDFTYINIFTEPFALGLHCIVLNHNKQNYDLAFIKKLDLNERYIVTNKKDFRINFDGCFTPSLPYGFAPLQMSVPWFLSKIIKDNFEDNHYTIPFLSILDYKKENINEEMSSEISPYEVKLKIWKK